MHSSPRPADSALAQDHAAPQHGPRPLPLFLNILWRETEGDPDLRKRAFAGLRRYQEAIRPAPPSPPPCAALSGNARLLRYGRDNARAPVVFVPSLINPPRVLDLSQSRSMLRHMAAAGHDTYLVDWGTPLAEDADMTLAGHARERLLPLLAGLSRPPLLVGYCLGGTIALAAAMLRSVAGFVTIATPWTFSNFPMEDRERIAALWRQAKPMCQRLGYVPMEVLQSGFWAIDPARTIRRYAAFADMEEGSDAALALLAMEDWANEGPPLTFAAGCELFEQLYDADVTGAGQWSVDGLPVGPDRLTGPSLAIASTIDRIVPAGASPALDETWRLELGHVGMVVGGRAREALWDPLSRWLSTHGG